MPKYPDTPVRSGADMKLKAAPAKKTSVKQIAKKLADKLAPPKLKITVAAAADKLYTVREERLGHDRESTRLKKDEATFRDYLIDQLPKGEAKGVMGQLASAYVDDSPQYTAKDWGAIYAQIVSEYKKAKTDGERLAAFRYLNRALSQEPMQEIWETGKTFPGVQRIPVKKVYLSKVKGRKK